ncbi:MAG TPA: ABC transporter ATP-binding protein [Solirubrobacteraceae bacterium]|nr:ABC transporter ATP-binding protein [Solirubrobacteraceae bacterium]
MLRVERVSKTFALPRDRVHTLKETVLRAGRRRPDDRLEALRDVSFDVQPGEFFGIVGRNGSGKSTLLKCLGGIYRADSGRIWIHGRVATFIELGVGFNPDLAARDNVMLNGTLLGLSPREARRRYDAVIDFAELHEFVDLKVKNYSSGMLVRLAFSVMIQVDADVLLIDEVLAVGDAAFQQKCFDEFARLRRSGTTVLLVTHDMGAATRFCDRAMVLERGRVAGIGETRQVAEEYLRLNFSAAEREAVAAASREDGEAAAAKGRDAEEAPAEEAPAEEAEEAAQEAEAPAQEAAERDPLAPDRWGDGSARIVDAWFEDADGARADVLVNGERCNYAARVRFDAEVVDPLFGINVHDTEGRRLLTANNVYEPPSGAFRPGDEVEFRIAFLNVLAPGRYLASPAVAHSGAGLRWIDRCVNLHDVTVISTTPTDALIVPPYEFELRPAPSREAQRPG